MKKVSPDRLEQMSDDELLSLKFNELDLKIEGTWIEDCVGQLYKELSAKGIDFHPPCYLADEWLCPDGEPVIGVAFFLAHPRLKNLERKIMLEAEGADKASCMRLLRHEAGHAINYAYSLYKRTQWRRLFGKFSKQYPEKYKYRPYSKSFVRHLEGWYAQYHPDEDFSETFAVWLDPGSDWEEKYKGWKALGKLKYVDKVMKEVSLKPPRKNKGEKHWDISQLRLLLKTYYKRKKDLYADEYPDFHDDHLKKIFFERKEKDAGEKAFKLIKRKNKEILNNVGHWTGEKKFIINKLLKDLAERSKQLELVSVGEESNDSLKVAVYVTTQIMNYRYTGRYKKKK